MNKKILWITETAVMIAVLVALQAVTKPMGQFVTGSCVNMVLAVSALVGGLWCGVTVALISPVMAFVLGNTVFVVLLYLLAKDSEGKPALKIAAWLLAAVAKFATLYILVSEVICGLLATSLMDAGMLKAPMLNALPATFSWPQLVTALIGGGIALTIVPLIRKAVKK